MIGWTGRKACEFAGMTGRQSATSAGEVVQIWRDVTECKRMEEALWAREEHYLNVYDTTPLAAVIWDTECCFADWNERAVEMFGWMGDEAASKSAIMPFSFVSGPVPNDR